VFETGQIDRSRTLLSKSPIMTMKKVSNYPKGSLLSKEKFWGIMAESRAGLPKSASRNDQYVSVSPTYL
jgi:hypothetical protein